MFLGYFCMYIENFRSGRIRTIIIFISNTTSQSKIISLKYKIEKSPFRKGATLCKFEHDF